MASPPSSVTRFLRLQVIYIGVGAIGTAVFWAIGQNINPATVLVYSLCIGNLATPLMNRVRSAYSQRPFPYNWLLFLAALTLLTPVIYIISSIVVWLIAPPSPQSLEHLLRTGWKFPCLIVVVVAIISSLFRQNKEHLEVRNAELQRSVDLTAAELERQDQDMQRAREIQESLLPKEIPQLPGFEISTSWSPARMVGGDYFDVLRLSDNRLGICIADVVGKSVSAALLMASVQAMVRAFSRDSESLARMCTRVNGVLCGNIAADKFVTFFYAILDADKHSLKYCSAGHPAPLLVSSDCGSRLCGGGAVLGVFPTWKYEDSTVNLSPGARLLLFTDGITEAADPQGLEFGENALAAFAQSHCADSAAELNREILAQITHFCEGKFQDDTTLVVVAAT